MAKRNKQKKITKLQQTRGLVVLAFLLSAVLSFYNMSYPGASIEASLATFFVCAIAGVSLFFKWKVA